MRMDAITVVRTRWPRRMSAALPALALAASLVGCATLTPPPYSAPLDSELQTLKTDADTLYTRLQAPAPDCTHDANKAAFDTVGQDLAQLNTLSAAPNNSHTAGGVAKLDAGWRSFEKAYADGGGQCLPPRIVADKQASFDLAVDRLIKDEQGKPGAPKP